VWPEQIPDDVLESRVAEAAAVAEEHAASVDAEARYPREALAALRRLGLLTLLVPSDLGGCGGTLGQFVDTVRQLAGACGATALCYAMHGGARHMLVAQAQDGRLAARLRASCAAQEIYTLAVSPARHPDGGQSSLALQRVTGGYMLSGRKAWCTGVAEATTVLVFVPANATGDVPVPTVLCIQPRETRGLCIEETWQGTGLRGSRSDTIVFERAFVPHTTLVGEEGRGDALLAATDAPTLLGLAAASLGCGEAAVRAAAHMLGGRLEQGASLPPVALDLAGADVALRAAAAAVETAVRMVVADAAGARPAILAAKAASNLAAVTAADAALAAAGASGYQRGSPLERHWRDAHGGRLMLPTPEDCRSALAQTLLGWS